MLLPLLVGCGGDDADRKPVEGPIAEEDAPTPPGLRPKEIEGATLRISGSVEGEDRGQVRFQAVTGSTSKPLHIAEVKGGRFSVEAPAMVEGPVYVSFTVDRTGNGPSADDPIATLAEPVVLAGQDLELTLVVGTVAPWAIGLSPPVNQVLKAREVYGTDPFDLSGGGEPSSNSGGGGGSAE